MASYANTSRENIAGRCESPGEQDRYRRAVKRRKAIGSADGIMPGGKQTAGRSAFNRAVRRKPLEFTGCGSKALCPQTGRNPVDRRVPLNVQKCGIRLGRQHQKQTKQPPAARNLVRLSRFLQRESRGGRVPPPRRIKRGSPARAAAPLRIPSEYVGDGPQRSGTFYFVGFRNFLFCVDKREPNFSGSTRNMLEFPGVSARELKGGLTACISNG